MTIAVCYLSPEGVVFGADSTSSTVITPLPNSIGYHYYNHNQKLFEIGEDSSLGIVTWSLGGLGNLSYRTLIARLGDDLKQNPAPSVQDVAARWSALFWPQYSAFLALPQLQFAALRAKQAFDPNANPILPNNRTKDEEQLYQRLLRDLTAGFIIGGHCLPEREPKAFQIAFQPAQVTASTATEISIGSTVLGGVPNMFNRLIRGYDDSLKQSILLSGQWRGTEADLMNVLNQQTLSHAVLPIRDAIDYVHACISSTIKAMKFSQMFQVCGGPIEIAVVTSDRRFRWVRHKQWDAAIEEGAL